VKGTTVNIECHDSEFGVGGVLLFNRKIVWKAGTAGILGC